MRELLLRNGGGEVDVPGGETRECLIVTREQTVQERRAASQIADDEERLFDLLCFMSGEENVIQEETKPVDELSNGPDRVEHQQEDDSFACQTGGSIFGCEKGAIGCSPKEAEIGIHSVWDPCLAFMEKARTGFLFEYSIRKPLIWINPWLSFLI